MKNGEGGPRLLAELVLGVYFALKASQEAVSSGLRELVGW